MTGKVGYNHPFKQHHGIHQLHKHGKRLHGGSRRLLEPRGVPRLCGQVPFTKKFPRRGYLSGLQNRRAAQEIGEQDPTCSCKYIERASLEYRRKSATLARSLPELFCNIPRLKFAPSPLPSPPKFSNSFLRTAVHRRPRPALLRQPPLRAACHRIS